MRKSKFTDDRKRKIIQERDDEGLTVEQICRRYKISLNTFYLWRRELFPESPLTIQEPQLVTQDEVDETELRVMKRLYLNLSAQNYELAKILVK